MNDENVDELGPVDCLVVERPGGIDGTHAAPGCRRPMS
jgi:hypothetical protein